MGILLTLMEPEQQIQELERHHIYSELRLLIASYAADHTLPLADQKKFGVVRKDVENLLH